MMSESGVCGGLRALGRSSAAAVATLAMLITSIGAVQHHRNATHVSVPIRAINNRKLSQQLTSVIDHDFVILASGNLVDAVVPPKSPCAPGQASALGQYVVDPVTENDGSGPVSLEQIVSAARQAGSWVILLRSGVYHLSGPLMITAASGTLAIKACPGETPVIDAPADGPAVILKDSHAAALVGLVFSGPSASHVVMDGAEDCLIERNTFLNGNMAITLDHARRNQIVGNVIQNVASTGIELKDGSDQNIIADNFIDGANAPETSGGGIFLHGARGNRIAHNVIQRTTGFGIGVSNWDETTINVDNIVEFNLLRRTVLNSDDSGAIYVLGRSGVDTNVVIASNVIDGFGSPGHHNVGIYLDDSTNGATVIGNLVRGVGSDAVQIHGGQDNHIENNLLDLGAGRPSALLFQAAPADTNPLNRQTGNIVSRNVILSSNASPRPYVWYDGGSPVISGNFYVVPNGAVVSNESPVSDSDPQLGAADLLTSPSRPEYGPAQAAAERAIGFRPIDLRAAGVRRRP